MKPGPGVRVESMVLAESWERIASAESKGGGARMAVSTCHYRQGGMRELRTVSEVDAADLIREVQLCILFFLFLTNY